MKLILATRNKGKIKEIKALFGRDTEILTLEDVGFVDDIIEDKDTFLGNAMNKATISYDYLKSKYREYFFLAEDSGLEVRALGGRPGVYSARYAGENATDEENIKKLLYELKEVPLEKRDANYNCTAVLIFPNGKSIIAVGKCNGRIALEPRGKNGFGYDPVFLTEESNFSITMAELSEEEKNRISHRKKAIEGIVNGIKGLNS